MAKSQASRDIVLAREREVQALELRKAGATYEAIGAKLGMTAQGAHAVVKRVLERMSAETDEAAAEVRRLELERLDTAVLAIASQVKRGNLGAIDRWLRISESRRKLLGIDAPNKHEVITITPEQAKTMTTSEIEALLKERGVL
jgi:hypothetical protein